jgi:hypothetical protein
MCCAKNWLNLRIFRVWKAISELNPVNPTLITRRGLNRQIPSLVFPLKRVT